MPQPGARFVAQMEDILTSTNDPMLSTIRRFAWMKFRSHALFFTTRGSLPLESGQPKREVHEDERHGKCSLFFDSQKDCLGDR